MLKFLLILLFSIPVIFTNTSANSIEDLIPQPRQAYGRMLYSSTFVIHPGTKIYLVGETPAYAEAEYLNSEFRNMMGDTLQYAVLNSSDTVVNGIVLGVCDPIINNLLRHVPDQLVQVTPTYPGAEGYILDILPSQVLISGSDIHGLHYGITTFLQLLTPGNIAATAFAARVIDAPYYPVRWMMYPMNFQVGDNITKAKKLWKEAADYKMNGALVDDYKFYMIHDRAQFYIDSLVSAKKFADKNHFKFVTGCMPFGYSNALLYNDPNLAAGLPVNNQKFIIEGDTARVLPSINVTIPNGDFENNNGYYWGFSYIDDPRSIDNTEKHSGNSSIRMDNFNGSNSRIIYTTKVKPFTQYHVSAWVKTEGVSPLPEMKAIAKYGRALTYYNLPIPATTNGWQKFDYVFNSLDADTVSVYWGIWGANNGKIWWDDLVMEECAFVNLIRRPGAPLSVDNPLLNMIIREGVDFDSLIDRKMGMASPWPGDYDCWHQPPTFRVKPGGGLRNGDTVNISYSFTTYIYDGQVMASMSEPKTYDVVERDFRIIDSLLKPNVYFMGHDEIRVMNWDQSDRTLGDKKAMTPAEILAYNVNKCVDIIHKYKPNAEIWDWTDMFDEYHNAVDGPYYLVNGTLKGSANLIPKSVGMVSWNSGSNRQSSLNFFNNKGFRQIAAPFYDEGIEHIRNWRLAALNTPNFLGMMYTTWIGDFSKINAFAEYAWSQPPYIYHFPPMKNTKLFKDFQVSFTIKDDRWDDNAHTKKAYVYYRTNVNDNFKTITCDLDANNSASANLGLTGGETFLQYYITAGDSVNHRTKIPFGDTVYFEVGENPTSVNDKTNSDASAISIYPNPVTVENQITVELTASSESVIIELKDIQGKELLSKSNRANSGETIKTQVDLSGYSAGTYFIHIKNGEKTEVRKVVKY